MGSHRERCASHGQGASLLEILVACAIATVVLGAIDATWSSGWRLGRAAQLSASVGALALLELTLREDVAQMGADNVCPLPDICRLTPAAFAFDKVRFDKGHPDKLLIHSVKYQVEALPTGNKGLFREEWGKRSRCVSAAFENLSFLRCTPAAGQFVRIVGAVLDQDVPRGTGTGKLAFAMMVRLPVPVELCNSEFQHVIQWQREDPQDLFAMPFP